MPSLRIPAILLALALPVSAQADLPWLKDLAGGRDLPKTWGIGIDFYWMEQDYDITSLDFDVPGVIITNPENIAVSNDIYNFDIKADVWLFPFLNAFVVLGQLDGDTIVDLSDAGVENFPFPLGSLDVELDGTVYGGGLTFAVGGDRWFTTLTTVYTTTSLDGDFNSSIDTFVAQPRIGLVRDQWQFWVGGMYLDAEESHSGVFELILPPGVGPPSISIPFEAELETQEKWNYTLGARHVFSENMDMSFEIGFGDRKHTLVNWTWRF